MAERTDLPLTGLRIVEFAGIGPGPFAAMMLADMGAEVIRVDRINAEHDRYDFLARGRRSIALDLKQHAAVDVALMLVDRSDGLIEGFRPGVMERLGLGPDVCRARNPRLVYGRMTGWGQDGPLAQAAGHDLNYIALTGALWATGPADSAPMFAANLLGDFGGGGMFLALGMVAGLLQAARVGEGDVVDAAITEGTHTLMSFIHARRASNRWQDARGANTLDGGVPWYAVYACACGGWISIAALEPRFWQELLRLLQLDEAVLGDRTDPAQWPSIRTALEETFQSKPRDHWVALLEGTDACFAPVLSPAEAAQHPHNRARSAFAATGPDQPMPAPRFGDKRIAAAASPDAPGAHSEAILADLGMSAADIYALCKAGAVKASNPQETAP
ncbi:MAG: CaiB/BaiF CoA-transferase family protein [Pseudomonadota bacterium]